MSPVTSGGIDTETTVPEEEALTPPTLLETVGWPAIDKGLSGKGLTANLDTSTFAVLPAFTVSS